MIAFVYFAVPPKKRGAGWAYNRRQLKGLDAKIHVVTSGPRVCVCVEIVSSVSRELPKKRCVSLALAVSQTLPFLTANLSTGERIQGIRDRRTEVRGISDSLTAYVRVFSICFSSSSSFQRPRITPLLICFAQAAKQCGAPWTALPSIRTTPEQVSPLFACAAEKLLLGPQSSRLACKTYVDGALAVRPSARDHCNTFAMFAFAFAAA
jgi:hypothetical protein